MYQDPKLMEALKVMVVLKVMGVLNIMCRALKVILHLRVLRVIQAVPRDILMAPLMVSLNLAKDLAKANGLLLVAKAKVQGGHLDHNLAANHKVKVQGGGLDHNLANLKDPLQVAPRQRAR